MRKQQDKKQQEYSFNGLIAAIKKSQLEQVIEYHRQGISFNNYTENGDTPLHKAARLSKLQIVRYIVENVKEINIEDKNFDGDTALMIATLQGNLKLIQYLIEEARSNPNTQDNYGFTPFMAAVSNAYLNILQYYVDQVPNLDLSIKTYDGQNPCHRAAFYGNIEILKFLRKQTSISLNEADRSGNTPLHYACMRYNIPCARYIIRRNKDSCLKKVNKKGLTPLDIMHRNINEVKEEDVPNITLDEVREYIVNNNIFVVYKALNKENIYRKDKLMKSELPKNNTQEQHNSNNNNNNNIDNTNNNNVNHISPSNKFLYTLKDKFFGSAGKQSPLLNSNELLQKSSFIQDPNQQVDEILESQSKLNKKHGSSSDKSHNNNINNTEQVYNIEILGAPKIDNANFQRLNEPKLTQISIPVIARIEEDVSSVQSPVNSQTLQQFKYSLSPTQTKFQWSGLNLLQNKDNSNIALSSRYNNNNNNDQHLNIPIERSQVKRRTGITVLKSK